MDEYEVRKQKVWELIASDFYKPMKIKELAILMQVQSQDRPVLEQILKELQQEGRIVLSKRGRYSRAEESTEEGVFTAHPKGFGFVTIEGREQDIFIPADKTGGALHKDRVKVRISPLLTGKRQEGVILEVLERGMKTVVGTFEKTRSYGFVVPDEKKYINDIFIPAEAVGEAIDGQKVVAEITDYGTNGKNPQGKITEILGMAQDPGVDILSIARNRNIPVDFPEKVQNQAVRVARPVSEADCAGRLDLREVPTVTIDGEDSKDFDDAVSLRKEGDNYILGVHIADVTNYVQEGSALDQEALKRGTSVYLPDRVIPMLPFELSNGICSLNEGEDRLALSCIMTINPAGEIVDHQIAETVIRSDRRMTYTKVNAIITGQDPEPAAEYAALSPMFCQMYRLSLLLRARREKRGAVDFDFPESRVILDEEGRTIGIRPYERNAATMLIEDFMLAANETVAEEYFWREIPFVYRTHEKPDMEKMRSLAASVLPFGYTLRCQGEEMHPNELQKLLKAIRGSEEEALLARLTLRSMKQARYTVDCTGHFGLAARYYTHFTSPIRRYPDLQIHRIIKDTLRGRMTAEKEEHYRSILPSVSKACSENERRAEETEREAVKMKKVEYMSAHIGECFRGTISGVTEYGMYVELPSTVEGFIRVSELMDDFYEYNETLFELKGRQKGRSFRLGDSIRIRVGKCDKQLRTIDFELA